MQNIVQKHIMISVTFQLCWHFKLIYCHLSYFKILLKRKIKRNVQDVCGAYTKT